LFVKGLAFEFFNYFSFSKSQFLFEHFIFLFSFTKREPHFGQTSPVGFDHKTKSHFGKFDHPKKPFLVYFFNKKNKTRPNLSQND
jgi:hypothetical protein